MCTPARHVKETCAHGQPVPSLRERASQVPLLLQQAHIYICTQPYVQRTAQIRERHCFSSSVIAAKSAAAIPRCFKSSQDLLAGELLGSIHNVLLSANRR